MPDKEIISRFKTLIEKEVELPALQGVISQVSNVETLTKFYETAVRRNRVDVIKCLVPDKLQFSNALWEYWLEHGDGCDVMYYFFKLGVLDPNEVGVEAIECGNPEILRDMLDWYGPDDVDVEFLLLECQKDFNLDMIKILVDYSADIHIFGDEMFYSAVESGKIDVVNYIIWHSAECEEEIYCKDDAQREIVKKYTDAYLKSFEPEECESESESDSDSDVSRDSYRSNSE